jgi:transmembrane sensor
VLIGGGVVLWRGQKGVVAGKAAPVAILRAGRGSRKMTRLPDGTQLWLNAGSRVVLAQGFSQEQRELTLEGEAFFDVQHDENHPFVIHTGALEVRVLGTSLNVRAYPGESSMEATLIDGKAEIGLAGNPQSAIPLRPNEKVMFRVDAGNPLNFIRRPIVPDRTDGTIVETSWTKNKLVFRNETLGSLSTRLERWYNVTIVFDDKRYQQDTISGTFPDMPIEDVMHALRITSGFQYAIEKDTVHIW